MNGQISETIANQVKSYDKDINLDNLRSHYRINPDQYIKYINNVYNQVSNSTNTKDKLIYLNILVAKGFKIEIDRYKIKNNMDYV